jgi:hypothetical protein
MYAVVDYNALPRHSFTCQQGNTPLSEEGGVRKERAQKRICTRVASPSEEFEIVDKPNLSFLLAFICSSIHHSPPQKEAVLPPSCAVCSGSLRFLSYLPHRAPFMKETRKKEDNQQNQREDNKKGWCELQCRLPHLTQQPQQFLLFSLSFFFCSLRPLPHILLGETTERVGYRGYRSDKVVYINQRLKKKRKSHELEHHGVPTNGRLDNSLHTNKHTHSEENARQQRR